MTVDTELKQKVAIVTGGAGGIGRAYALRLAQLGADVAIIDIDLSVAVRHGEVLTAADVMEEVKALGRAGIGIEADLTQQKQTADGDRAGRPRAWPHRHPRQQCRRRLNADRPQPSIGIAF
jgi:NAD(P)-dependent dehydrogenase (short-subunit alcohol dehydrogenase family)